MEKEIVWSDDSKEDLKHIFEFISRDSTKHAHNFLDQIIEEVDNTSKFSKKGRVVPEINIDVFRETFVGPYRIIYQELEEEILILIIFHMSRNFLEIKDKFNLN